MSDSVEELNEFLQKKGWLEQDEFIKSMEKPGEGNMNLVKRVITNKRSFIIKQARPWVEKYPTIDAPIERSFIEAEYFRKVNEDKVIRSFSPGLLFSDRDNFILIVNDLGNGADYTFLYQPDEFLLDSEISDLTRYLSILHRLEIDRFPENRSMRLLNHEHIFRFPYLEDNGLNLDDIQSGLMDIAVPVKKNKELISQITKYGKIYLEAGPALIHGDYFPGSWLRTGSGPKIIDPEFSFMGYPEFDLGVFVANMAMARQTSEILEKIIKAYNAPVNFKEELFAAFTGIEVLRRLIGVGQLPLALSIERKKALTEIAIDWILKKKLDFSSYSHE
jgi:5-methylthioribose kinase